MSFFDIDSLEGIKSGKSFLKNSKLLELPGCEKSLDLEFQGRGYGLEDERPQGLSDNVNPFTGRSGA